MYFPAPNYSNIQPRLLRRLLHRLDSFVQLCEAPFIQCSQRTREITLVLQRINNTLDGHNDVAHRHHIVDIRGTAQRS